MEQTKLTSKKRKGVVHFVKHFPVYIGFVESQLIGADALEVRGTVDAAYDRIVQAMFESLKQMAKMTTILTLRQPLKRRKYRYYPILNARSSFLFFVL